MATLGASPTSATAAPTPGETTALEVPTRAIGISGTANYGGDIYSESNAKLLYAQAYGLSGQREWGEWESLLRTDSAVAAGLDFVCGPIRDARVDVEPVDDSDEAKRIAEFVRWNFTEGLEPTFPELLTQAVKGFLGVGFALFEPTLKIAEHPLLPGGRGYVLDKVSQRLPNTLTYNAWLENDDASELRAVRQQGQRGLKWESIVVPADRLLLFTWQRDGNNYSGFSAFRAVWYIAQIRKELLRLVGVTYQREGAGVPVMEATDRAAELTPNQRTDMERLLANLVYHENASLVPPAGWTLKWTFSGGANKGHVLDAWHRLGVTILEQVQAQQLALGTGDTGSRSVGTVHDASARAFISSVVAVLEGVFNGVGSRPYTGLVRRLVDASFGPQKSYPRLRLTLKQAQLSPKEMLEAVSAGVAARALTITARDENSLREKLGLSPIDEAERSEALGLSVAGDVEQVVGAVAGAEKAADTALNGAQVTAATDLIQRVADGMLPFDSALEALVIFFNIPRERAAQLMRTLRTFEPERTTPRAPTAAASASLRGSAPKPNKPWVPWRPLRASEKNLDLTAMDSFLASRPEVFERDVRPVVVEMLVKAAPAITAAMADGDVTPGEVAALPLDSKRLDAVIAVYLDDVRAEGARTVRRELRDGIAEKVLQERRDALTAAAGEEDEQGDEREDEVITQEADDVIDAEQERLRKRMVDRLRQEVEREAIDTMRTGGDASEVVSRTVARQLDTGAFRSDAGYVTTKAFSVGRDEAARIMGGIASVDYSAILDNSTCDACRSMDGRTATFDSPEHDAMLPPNRDCDGGDRCRCILVFIPERGDE